MSTHLLSSLNIQMPRSQVRNVRDLNGADASKVLETKGLGLGHAPFQPWVSPVRLSTLSIAGMYTE